MPHALNMASPGLQALIFCGPGSSFPTFAANPDENPKALLNIANRPMVWYPLDWCYRAGITDITLVCPPSAAKAITAGLNTNLYLTNLPHPRPDLLAPKDLDQNTGTAEILRLPELQELVTGDFIVLPCDLVCELGGDKLLQAWMVKAASLADLIGDPRSHQRLHSGGLAVWYQTKTATTIKGEETDFLATVSLPPTAAVPAKGSVLAGVSKLVYSMPTDSFRDLVGEKDGFPIRHGLMRKHPRLRFRTSHRDAHLYIFPHWLMRFIQENDRLESIGEDVIGWWAKAGWQKGLPAKLGFDRIHKSLATPVSMSPKEEVLQSEASSPRKGIILQSVTARDKKDAPKQAELLPEPDSSSVPPILAYIHPDSGPEALMPLIRRVDTAQLLLHISLQLAKLPSIEETGPSEGSPFAHARKVAYPEGVKPRTTISRQDTLVGENVTVQEKSSIKESVVGANCRIHEGVKLTQCLLMDGVIVGKNCKLTKCILGKNSEIGEGSTMTECEVQENLLVDAKTEAKGEKYMSSSGLEATDEDYEGLDAGSDNKKAASG